MLKKILFLFLIFFSYLAAQNKAYIVKHGDELSIGNDYIERVISINPKDIGTNEIKNKISGKTYHVKSDVFGLQIVFTGVGPAYGKNQNGENDVVLTAKDFAFTGYKETDEENGLKKLSLGFKFDWEMTGFRLNVNYEISPERFSLRKWIEISDTSYGVQFLDRIYVESLTFQDKDFSRGQFGQPVFNNDLFLGVEYPTVENEISGNKLRIGYVVGEDIKKDPFISHTSIIGASPSPVKLEEYFMDYVDKIKVNGTRPYLLYNSWYDFRNPAIVNDSASVMDQKNVLRRIDTFKKYMFDKYGIALNAFVLDDGWDNYKSMWDIDSTRFPHGFTPFVNALKPMGTELGIWASPFCGYSNRDIRVDWGAAHGYERVGDFLCFAGTKYKAAYKNVMVDYTKKYDLGYFKWDGFLLACNETDHGHLPGIYSREANVKTYIDIINAVRKVNPKIYLNITTGTWLSPWWLKYTDCIWMQGADYAYAEDVPSLNDRDKSITYRDAVLWDNYQKLNLLFPMSSLMTHGIIKGRLNFLGGKNESLDSFSNEVMMYFGRGVTMWELYVSPDLLSDNEWNAIASSIKWAKENLNVLEKTRMILGNPLKKEVYGYIHLKKDKGIVLLRNPDVNKKNAVIKLSAGLGDIDSTKEYYVKVIYPYNYIYSTPVKLGKDIKIKLDGYEVLAAELVPSDKINKNLPVNIKYSDDNEKLSLYTDPGTSTVVKSVSGKNLTEIKASLEHAKIKISEKNNPLNNGSKFESKAELNVPDYYSNAKFGFLLESDIKLQNNEKPEFEIKVNGKIETPSIEEENGKWFWVTADLPIGESTISYSINFKDKIKSKISSWLISDKTLSKFDVKNVNISESELLPAKPYNADNEKEIIPIKNFKIQ